MPGENLAHMPLATFRSFIDAARQLGKIVPLRELVGRHVAGRSTSGLIAITADDAYASLLAGVSDYLVREAIPLTVFVVPLGSPGGAGWMIEPFVHNRLSPTVFPYTSAVL